MLGLLYLVQPNYSTNDDFVQCCYTYDFKVYSSYQRLQFLFRSSLGVDEGRLLYLKSFYSFKAPSKILFFSWHMLIERLPTRNDLAIHNLVCLLCFSANECVFHLFFDCPTTRKVWSLISNWLGLEVVADQVSLVVNFSSFVFRLRWVGLFG